MPLIKSPAMAPTGPTNGPTPAPSYAPAAASSLNANHLLSDFAVFRGKLIVLTRPAFDQLNDLVSRGKAHYVGTYDATR